MDKTQINQIQYEKTRHGDNIADQIQANDAYGHFNHLNPADVYNIIDQLHTHFLDMAHEPEMLPMLEGWMNQILEKWDVELP